MELEQLIREYLATGQLMQVASSREAQPWQAHVWYAFSPDLKRLVFTSNKSRRHSADVRDNPMVSCAIVAIPLEGLGQKVRGLVLEGSASEAAGDDLDICYELYASKWPNVRSMFSAQDIHQDATPMRMYDVRPTRFVLFDEEHYASSPRQEYVVESDKSAD